MRLADTQTSDFWLPLLNNDKFKEYVKSKYEITYKSILGEDETPAETAEEEV
jgi:hypothetical protein